MNDWYATNARNLLDNRKRGLKPEGPVVVALVPLQFAGTVLHVRPEMPADRMDWRMLANLDVWLWAGAKVSLDAVIASAWRIAQVRPKELILRFEHADYVHDIDCGSGHHLPAIADIPATHEFMWAPINVGGTRLGRRICRTLIATHPYGSML